MRLGKSDQSTQTPVFIANAARAGLLLTPREAAEVLRDWGFSPYQRDLWHCHWQALATLTNSEITEIVGEVPKDCSDF